MGGRGEGVIEWLRLNNSMGNVHLWYCWCLEGSYVHSSISKSYVQFYEFIDVLSIYVDSCSLGVVANSPTQLPKLVPYLELRLVTKYVTLGPVIVMSEPAVQAIKYLSWSESKIGLVKSLVGLITC